MGDGGNLRSTNSDSRYRGRVALAAVFFVVLFWAVIGVSLARAESPIETGVPSTGTTTSLTEEHEASSSLTEQVVLTVYLRIPAAGGECVAEVFVAGNRISFLKGVIKGTGSESVEPDTVTFILSKGQKYKVVKGSCASGGTVEFTSSYASLKGGEGPAGKEGPEGKPGAEGKEGKEGPAGKEGLSSVKLTSFSTEAQETLSELKESMEAIGWCIIGTMLALALGFWVMKVLRTQR
jgi:hypothetical protein